MRVKNINIIELQKRLEIHKRTIEENQIQNELKNQDDIVQQKAPKENIIKKKVTKKKTIDKKALKEKQKIIQEKAMEDAIKRNIGDDGGEFEKEKEKSEVEESKVVISKEERAKRFKNLHAVAQNMMKQWNQ